MSMTTLLTENRTDADRILDTAMALADNMSWEHLHMHHLSAEIGISLADIHQHFPVKDDLVDAWYDRADRAMLAITDDPDFQLLSIRQRLHALNMAWLDTLADHKQVSYDMLWYKLEPAHVHLQVQGLLRISMTVQWIRDAAGIDSTHLTRIAEEVGLTRIFLQSFLYWMFDNSPRQRNTRQYLDKQLARAEKRSLRWDSCTTLPRWMRRLKGRSGGSQEHHARHG